MDLIKKISFVVVLCILSVVTVVVALDSLTISPTTVTISPGDSLSFSTVASGATSPLTYEWSIDGMVVSSQTGSTLSLDWSSYLALFPSDATIEATRAVVVVGTDDTSSVSGNGTIIVEQTGITVIPTTSSVTLGLTGGDNYCGDGELKMELGEHCDDGNGKNGDGCTINCECENGYDCLEDGTIELIPEEEMVDPVSDSDNNGNENDSGIDDMNGDKPGVKDLLKERNRTPLTLGGGSDAMAPLETPSSGADRRLIGIYAESSETIDVSTVLPTRAQGHVAKPVYLPMTGGTDTGRPVRIIIF